MVDVSDPQVSGGKSYDTPAPEVADKPEVDPARAALVAEWQERIRLACKHWEPLWKRMEACEQLAYEGADKAWAASEAYTVPIIPRHINQIVAALYAKDPRVVATRRKRLMYQIWDGEPQSIQMALALQQQTAMAGMPPMADPMLMEIQAVDQYNKMVDKIGKTLEILWEYYVGEQDCDFKAEMKALVRRTKVASVGWCELGYQRILQKRPDVEAQIADVTAKIAATEASLKKMADGTLEETSAELEQLRLNLADLQAEEMMIVREGPVFDWPAPRDIILDPEVKNVKTLRGNKWYARKFNMTPKRVLETYGVDLKDSYTKHVPSADPKDKPKDEKKSECRVYKVHDKVNRQCFVIIEGYPDFVVEPQPSDVKLERFFPLFPLVFNEVESECEKFPPSDVWLMRHPQKDYNRAREGLREHRNANRPKYATARGALEDVDKQALADAPAHAIIEISGMRPEDDVNKKIQKFEHTGIDPNQYQVEEQYKDMLRAVGTQEANLGAISGGTATESSIAEQSRMSTIADNVDDLDEFLSALARATGQLMLCEVSEETAKEIAGPGAVWPGMTLTKEEIAKELLLEIKAGSSGRPNKAADLANLERGMPYLLQLPGINPEPIAQKYADLLDIDIEELFVAGVPSITALNSMAGKAAMGAGEGPEKDPNAQGGEGSDNSKGPQENENEPGPQPAFPAPMAGAAPGLPA